ncbi:hypothetical protein LTR78_009000 [Recurvomyces mirabilis]|uniref:Peptide hydrolase n=1 Tax=Recurvomyces mirabilis TaxID=574656 RepID=A0AAE0TPE6_9PEZI|nr:hypothetical protein LTR78_009000 [Recurvomyces mirabilis]KAK5150472.1 hypothetical protein LTS14_010162 [Recurvomyces mirabilis]
MRTTYALLAALAVAETSIQPSRPFRDPQQWRPKHKGGWWKPDHTIPWDHPSRASSTLTPTAIPTDLPLVDSAALQAAIGIDTLSDKAHELEDAAYSTLDRNRVRPFIALYSQSSGNLTVDGEEQGAEPFSYTPSGDFSAPFVAVANLGCNASDYPAEVAGNIALIPRGTCPFGLKSSLAGAAGAEAAVIYNNAPGPTGGGTLDVVADTISGDHNNILAVGAHSDSVYAGPGINDDGSGPVGILEVAEQLSSYKINNAVRFGCTLNASEQAKIRLYLDFDMIASPDYYYAIYDGDGSAFNVTDPAGSAEAEIFFEDYFDFRGLNYTPTELDERSDYEPFLDAGIASGGLFTGAEVENTEEQVEQFGGVAGIAFDANYHYAGHNYDNLNFEAFLVNTQAIAAAVAEYSTSFGSLPAANGTERSVKTRDVRKRQHVHSHASHKGSCGFAAES